MYGAASYELTDFASKMFCENVHSSGRNSTIVPRAAKFTLTIKLFERKSKKDKESKQEKFFLQCKFKEYRKQSKCNFIFYYAFCLRTLTQNVSGTVINVSE